MLVLDVEHAGQRLSAAPRSSGCSRGWLIFSPRSHTSRSAPPEPFEELLTGAGTLGLAGFDRAHWLLLDC